MVKNSIEPFLIIIFITMKYLSVYLILVFDNTIMIVMFSLFRISPFPSAQTACWRFGGYPLASLVTFHNFSLDLMAHLCNFRVYHVYTAFFFSLFGQFRLRIRLAHACWQMDSSQASVLQTHDPILLPTIPSDFETLWALKSLRRMHSIGRRLRPYKRRRERVGACGVMKSGKSFN